MPGAAQNVSTDATTRQIDVRADAGRHGRPAALQPHRRRRPEQVRPRLVVAASSALGTSAAGLHENRRRRPRLGVHAVDDARARLRRPEAAADPVFPFMLADKVLGMTRSRPICGDITYSPKSTVRTDLLADVGRPGRQRPRHRHAAGSRCPSTEQEARATPVDACSRSRARTPSRTRDRTGSSDSTSSSTPSIARSPTPA